MSATSEGFTITWEDDWSVDHVAEYDCYTDGGPSTCEGCIVRSANGDVLASLWCIDDADDDYRRQVEAELVDEARAYLDGALVAAYQIAARRLERAS